MHHKVGDKVMYFYYVHKILMLKRKIHCTSNGTVVEAISFGWLGGGGYKHGEIVNLYFALANSSYPL